MCPFKKDNCGNTSEVVFNATGESLSLNMSLDPGSICFYAIRAECGIPAFEPNDTDGITIKTIEYDDGDCETSDSNATDGSKIPKPAKKVPLSSYSSTDNNAGG